MNNFYQNQCKGCSASVRHLFEEIEAGMAEYLTAIAPEDRAPDYVYRKRLETCFRCSALYYGSTCSYCGCFVRMRALRSNKDCPYPGNSRWDES
jgi:hypothetical protein